MGRWGCATHSENAGCRVASGRQQTRAVPQQGAKQAELRRRAASGRQVALRSRGLLGAEQSPGVAWGKHLGRCGRSLSGEDTLGAGPGPGPPAFLAGTAGDAWLYEARRRGASPDSAHASRDPSDRRGKSSKVGSGRVGSISGFQAPEQPRDAVASKKKITLTTAWRDAETLSPGYGSSSDFSRPGIQS